jgi:hypothetical protein
MVGLASAPSRLVASRRPRSAGLAVLTERSVEPGVSSYVMARGVDPESPAIVYTLDPILRRATPED